MKTERKRQHKKRKKICISVCCMLLVLVVALPIGLYFLGEHQLEQNMYRDASETSMLQDQIYYKKHVWKRKPGVYTLMLLGVDIRRSDIEEGKNPIGQADAIMLAVMDTKDKKIHVISFPRDIMAENPFTDIDTRKEVQTTLLYAYAGGGTDGCAAVEQAVSETCYGLPVHGYAEMTLLAIPELNDAVGGVPVTIHEDLTALNPAFVEGQTIWLQGDLATEYLHCRDIYTAQSSLGRTGRHKEYVANYLTAFKSAWKKQPLLPLRLRHIIKKYGNSNLTLAEMWYLGWNFHSITANDVTLQTLDVNVAKEGSYEEYYVDAVKAQQMLVNILYE